MSVDQTCVGSVCCCFLFSNCNFRAALTSALCEHEAHGEGGAGRQTQEVFSSTEQWSDPKVLQNRLHGQTAAGLKRHYGQRRMSPLHMSTFCLLGFQMQSRSRFIHDSLLSCSGRSDWPLSCAASGFTVLVLSSFNTVSLIEGVAQCYWDYIQAF